MHSTMQDVQLTISAIVRHAASIHGNSEVITPDGTGYRSMSYRSVLGRAGRLANALRGLGITADQRVANFQWSNQEHLEAYCAVPPWARCCTPSTFVWLQSNSRTSPTMPAIRSSWWMRRLRHCWLVRYQRWSRCIRSSPPGRPRSAAGMREDGVALRGDPGAATGDFRLAEIDERSAAAMCYTSGTTGNPKGVVYSHRSTLHALTACTSNALAVSEADRILAIVPMFHANAWGLIYAALMSGADLVLPDRHLQAAPLVSIIEETQPTIAGAVPTIWNDVDRYLESNPPGHLLTSAGCLRGSAVPVSLMRAFEDKYNVPIVQAWGMTETRRWLPS